MAVINSYATLQTAVGDYLARSDLTSFIPNFIQNAEARIYRELRIRAMERSLSKTIRSGKVDVPSDFLEMKHAYLNTSPTQTLQSVTLDELYRKYPTRSSDAKPKLYARDRDEWHFGPYPDSDYIMKGTYYKRFGALSTDSTNWFTTNAPDLLLYASLVEAEPFIKNDTRLGMWESMYQRAKDSVVKEESAENFAGNMRIVAS